MSSRACVTCGDLVGPERYSLGYRYCTKKACVRENHTPMVIVEIAQTKTNAVIEIMDEKTLRQMKEGKFRRDPVVVNRQASHGDRVEMRAKPAKPVQIDPARIAYVQALADQGYTNSDIIAKGYWLKLTQREVTQYRAARRIRWRPTTG